MILLRRFMAWGTVSSGISSQGFQALRWRLWLAYLTAMSVIFGASATAVYIFLTRSLNQQLNQELLTLAQAAAPSLETVKTEGLQSLDKNLPWYSLFEREQGLEWFNTDGKLLAQEGTNFPKIPLAKNSFPARLSEGYPVTQQKGQVRTLTISVYTNDPTPQKLRLEGYIRASESTKEVEAALSKFQLGLGLGGITVLILSSITGVFLTQLVLEPTEQRFQRLKQFTADASHELRSPLTAINTAVEVMQNHPERIHPSDVKKLEAIVSATNQLTHLAEDLLFLARTDAAVAPLGRGWTSVPLDEILQDLVKQLEPQAQAKGITITAHLLSGISVNGNAAQLSRLFLNLLQNALKHTQTAGTVVLSMTKHKRFVVIRVEDTGMGIVPEYLPFIFRPFWRSDRARSRRLEGWGLGLAIAQTIAHQHGGKITVSSQVEVGSSFRVHLPLA